MIRAHGDGDLQPLARDWCTVAVLARPWGNRGELIADLWSGHRDRLEQLRTVYLLADKGDPRPRAFELESARAYRGRWIVKLRGVDSLTAAEELAGVHLCVPREQRPPAPEGAYYQADLIGCQVIEMGSGRHVGEVRDWIETGGTDLLQVIRSQTGQEILSPFARSICVEVDLQGRRVVVDLPEGLEELNRP